jgi:hypothetical protein
VRVRVGKREAAVGVGPPDVVRSNAVPAGPDRAQDRLERPRGRAPHVGLALAERQLDWIDVRGGRGQLPQVASCPLDRRAHLGVAVDGEVVKDDGRTRRQGREEPCHEESAGDRAREDAGCLDPGRA